MIFQGRLGLTVDICFFWEFCRTRGISSSLLNSVHITPTVHLKSAIAHRIVSLGSASSFIHMRTFPAPRDLKAVNAPMWSRCHYRGGFASLLQSATRTASAAETFSDHAEGLLRPLCNHIWEFSLNSLICFTNFTDARGWNPNACANWLSELLAGWCTCKLNTKVTKIEEVWKQVPNFSDPWYLICSSMIWTKHRKSRVVCSIFAVEMLSLYHTSYYKPCTHGGLF